jgi:hypothetical protein
MLADFLCFRGLSFLWGALAEASVPAGRAGIALAGGHLKWVLARLEINTMLGAKYPRSYAKAQQRRIEGVRSAEAARPKGPHSLIITVGSA